MRAGRASSSLRPRYQSRCGGDVLGHQPCPASKGRAGLRGQPGPAQAEGRAEPSAPLRGPHPCPGLGAPHCCSDDAAIFSNTIRWLFLCLDLIRDLVSFIFGCKPLRFVFSRLRFGNTRAVTHLTRQEGSSLQPGRDGDVHFLNVSWQMDPEVLVTSHKTLNRPKRFR